MFQGFRIIRRAFLICLVVVAAVPALAQARFNLEPPGSAAATPAAPPLNVTVARTATTSSAFQWGDAGIGAAGAFVLLVLGAGAATTVRRRRTGREVTA